MRPQSLFWAIAVAISSLFLATAPSHAVPAWARATGTPCNGCHFGGTNRLTKMGEDFLVRGHRLPGAEGAMAKPDDVKWSSYYSLSSKPRFIQNTDGAIATEFDVESFSIYTGGPLTKKYSYFVEYYMHERGAATSNTGGTVATATRSKLADAFLQYNSDSGSPTYLWARMGQIYPFLIYTASSGGRVTVSRPRAIQNNVGGGNLYTPRDRSYGASVGYVIDDSVKIEAGVVNSAGTNARSNLQEVNNFKDVFVTAEKEFDDFGSGVGVYGYSGRFLGLPVAAGNAEDAFSRYGVVGQFVRNEYEISGGWFTGRNDDPVLGGTTRRSPKLFYLEAAYNLSPDLTVFGRYDNQDNDLSAGANTTEGGAVGVSQRIPNIGRVAVEYVYAATKTPGVAAKALSRGTTVELNWNF